LAALDRWRKELGTDVGLHRLQACLENVKGCHLGSALVSGRRTEEGGGKGAGHGGDGLGAEGRVRERRALPRWARLWPLNVEVIQGVWELGELYVGPSVWWVASVSHDEGEG
jgi:hypothetical protein